MGIVTERIGSAFEQSSTLPERSQASGEMGGKGVECMKGAGWHSTMMSLGADRGHAEVS